MPFSRPDVSAAVVANVGDTASTAAGQILDNVAVHERLALQTTDLRPARSIEDAEKAERFLSTVKLVAYTASQRRILSGSFLCSATSAGSFRSAHESLDDAAAASVAMTKVFQHLDVILQEGTVDDPMSVERGLEKVEALHQSRIPDGMHEPFIPSQYHIALIRAAASASKKVYSLKFPEDLLCKPKGDDKPCSVKLEVVDGRSMIIVALRGTASLADIVLDVNTGQKKSEQIVPERPTWHKGFQRVAQSLVLKIVSRITELAASTADIGGILITGHSLGGGVAQVLYGHGFRPGTELFNAVRGFDEVHCITFGAPPVSTSLVQARSNMGVFLSIINLGDPVPLAQETYIKTLFAVYALSPSSFATQYGTFVLPLPIYRVSGDCVVLADADPENRASRGVKALRVPNDVIETRLFGDPWMHFMDQYLENLKGAFESDW